MKQQGIFRKMGVTLGKANNLLYKPENELELIYGINNADSYIYEIYKTIEELNDHIKIIGDWTFDRALDANHLIHKKIHELQKLADEL